MVAQGMNHLRLPLEEQADQEGGEAVTKPIVPEVQAFKAVPAARAMTTCALPLGEVGVVLGLLVPQVGRVWLVMAGTGTSCRSPQS